MTNFTLRCGVRIMRLPLLAASALLAMTASARAANAPLEFVGLLQNPADVRVALKDPATGDTAWVKIGQSFDGYAVTRFDPATQTVVIQKAGVEFKLPLAQSKTRAGDTDLPQAVTIRILSNLRQLAAAADQYFLEHGVTQVAYDQLVGPEKDKYIREVVPVAGEDYRAIHFAQGQWLRVQTSGGVVIAFQP